MSEREALLQAILDDPDSDQIRLVYADWLEEFGGEPERAEFIRLQIDNPSDARIKFLSDISTAWVRRGFYYSVGCTMQYWLDRGPRLVREHPVQVVRITDKEPDVIACQVRQVPLFLWLSDQDSEEGASVIPQCIYTHMEQEDIGGELSCQIEYPTRVEAENAFSRNCLKWAKQQPNTRDQQP